MIKQKNPPKKSIVSIKPPVDIAEAEASEVYKNISSPIICTTEDKIYIVLSKHMKQMEKKRSWIAPSGILITLIAVHATSTFKTALGLSPDTWCAIFIITGVATLLWLILSIKDAMGSKKIEVIIDEFKKK